MVVILCGSHAFSHGGRLRQLKINQETHLELDISKLDFFIHVKLFTIMKIHHDQLIVGVFLSQSVRKNLMIPSLKTDSEFT